MNISKHNYEAYFLDYHEGNLSPQEVAELLLFVEQHPELKEEFESFENVTLEDFSSYSFTNKESLKKEITTQNREMYFARSVDGTLNAADIALLGTFLKHHPQYAREYELYQKTKLFPDLSVVFPAKAQLKKARRPEETSGADNLLISAVEGLLAPEEHVLLEQQLSVDPELRRNFELFQQTKLQADASIVFERKETLKRTKKIIPLYYYASAIAAAVLVLFGLFFLFSGNKQNGHEFAKNSIPSLKLLQDKNETAPSVNENSSTAGFAAVQHVKTGSAQENRIIRKDSSTASPVLNEQPQNLAVQTPEHKTEEPEKEIAVVPENNTTATPANTTGTSLAKNESAAKPAATGYYSLGQMAVARIKQKTLPSETYEKEKRSGTDKKLSGWDILSAVAKGVSKLTGKTVEVQHTSADEGTVTAMR